MAEATPPESLNTPLHVACFRGYIECVREIVQSPGWLEPLARVAILNSSGESCVSALHQDFRLEMVRQIRSFVRVSPSELIKAVDHGEQDKIINYVRVFGPDTLIVDFDARRETTLMLEAIRKDKVPIVDCLLRKGANPNFTGQVFNPTEPPNPHNIHPHLQVAHQRLHGGLSHRASRIVTRPPFLYSFRLSLPYKLVPGTGVLLICSYIMGLTRISRARLLMGISWIW
eukprot:GHVN01100035.1.p1 GENE.GHVN01100035.1~~GHVN01100035.1.p1  ORF type:complete len:229 (+),score=14.00 GHVN01100035.1:9-695(+)